jgi:hypothetical protein
MRPCAEPIVEIPNGGGTLAKNCEVTAMDEHVAGGNLNFSVSFVRVGDYDHADNPD